MKRVQMRSVIVTICVLLLLGILIPTAANAQQFAGWVCPGCAAYFERTLPNRCSCGYVFRPEEKITEPPPLTDDQIEEIGKVIAGMASMAGGVVCGAVAGGVWCFGELFGAWPDEGAFTTFHNCASLGMEAAKSEAAMMFGVGSHIAAAPWLAVYGVGTGVKYLGKGAIAVGKSFLPPDTTVVLNDLNGAVNCYAMHRGTLKGAVKRQEGRLLAAEKARSAYLDRFIIERSDLRELNLTNPPLAREKAEKRLNAWAEAAAMRQRAMEPAAEALKELEKERDDAAAEVMEYLEGKVTGHGKDDLKSGVIAQLSTAQRKWLGRIGKVQKYAGIGAELKGFVDEFTEATSRGVTPTTWFKHNSERLSLAALNKMPGGEEAGKGYKAAVAVVAGVGAAGAVSALNNITDHTAMMASVQGSYGMGWAQVNSDVNAAKQNLQTGKKKLDYCTSKSNELKEQRDGIKK